MKAAITTRYGGPEAMIVGDVPDPVCGPGDMIVRALAATVDSGDARVRAMRMPPGFGLAARLAFGISKPRQPILGTVVCGEVVRLGPGITRHGIRDRIIASTGLRFGAHAELVRISAREPVAAMPPGFNAEEAAALVFGGMTALHYVRDVARVSAGDRVLVHGASGSVGTAAVQIARHLGADVDGVCRGTNAALVRSLGAARVIDYTRVDPAGELDRYDVVLDTVGGRSFADWRGVLRFGGRCAFVAAGWREFATAVRTRRSDRRALAGVAPESEENLREIARLAEIGALRPVIDSVYGLTDIAKAHARVDSNRKVGSVVVRFTPQA